jgi:hypothetical protein
MKKNRVLLDTDQIPIEDVASYYDSQTEKEAIADLESAVTQGPPDRIVDVAIVCKDRLFSDGLKAICLDGGYTNIREAKSVLEVVLSIPNNLGPAVILAVEDLLDEKDAIQLQMLKSSRDTAVLLVSGRRLSEKQQIADKIVNKAGGAVALMKALKNLLVTRGLRPRPVTVAFGVSESLGKYGRNH